MKTWTNSCHLSHQAWSCSLARLALLLMGDRLPGVGSRSRQAKLLSY